MLGGVLVVTNAGVYRGVFRPTEGCKWNSHE